MATPRWSPLHRTCPSYKPTEEGMTDFVKRHRDLLYCESQGCREDCGRCTAHQNCGYGDNSSPSIRFTKGYSCPL